jgi:RND family efflux transporter MFP subunit
MDEALDQQACVAWPGLPGADARRVAAQAQLARLSQASAVCSVPLVAVGEPVGALSLERTEPFDEATRHELERIAAFVAPVIALRRQADRPLATLGAKLRARLFGRGRRLGLVLVAIGVAVAAAAWVPVPDRVSAAARVEGAVQRALTAPSDGWLMRVHVRPGDAVRAEQVLVELDDRDLSLERLRHATEAEQADRQATEAIAREDRAQFAVHSARAAQARAQLALIDARLDRQRVRAPFDGIVLAGDLTQSLGAPVRAGDALLSVAPAGRHRIVVEVDERDIARITPGGAGELALTAHAGRRVPIEVVRIAPAAVVRDGRNVFEVEARPAADADLRPGYLGVAKLNADARPVLRSALERPWRAISQRLWAWGW